MQIDDFLSPFHLNGLRVIQQQFGNNIVETFHFFMVESHNNIALLHPHIGKNGIAYHPVFHIFSRQVGFTPGKQDSDINGKGQQHIHHHPSQHNQQALPGGFGTKFPGLSGLFHLLGIHRFVHHSRNLHISSQRQPADTVFRFPFFKFKQRKPGIEKHIEFFYPRFKKLCKKEMSELVEQNQNGKAQYKLQHFNQYIHNISVFLI